MRQLAAVGLALAGLGCSDITATSGGVVALELRLPNPAVVEQDDTLQLRARALNASGDSVPATIIWRTPDSTLTLDSTGLVSSPFASGSGRVQARTGSLLSDLVILQIRRRSDSVALAGPDTVAVPAGDSASAALDAAVLSLTPDTAGITGTTLLYQVVDTALAQGALHFAGGGLGIRATTGSDGHPVVPVTLRKAAGVTPPAAVRVQVSAARPSGTPVPGSGQLLTVTFQ